MAVSLRGHEKKMAKRTRSQLSPSRGQTEKLQKNELKINHKDDKSGLVPWSWTVNNLKIMLNYVDSRIVAVVVVAIRSLIVLLVITFLLYAVGKCLFWVSLAERGNEKLDMVSVACADTWTCVVDTCTSTVQLRPSRGRLGAVSRGGSGVPAWWYPWDCLARRRALVASEARRRRQTQPHHPRRTHSKSTSTTVNWLSVCLFVCLSVSVILHIIVITICIIIQYFTF